MATPQSTTSQDVAPGHSKKPEQVTFRFCSECSNMLYPKEDEDAHKLQFTCRTCQYTEDAQTTCVFRNVLNTSAGETAGVTQDVGSDPTVSASSSPVICLCCGLVVNCVTCGLPMDHAQEFAQSVDEMFGRYDGIKFSNSNIQRFEECNGLEVFIDPWNNDPFANYDEELMPDNPCDNTSVSDSSDSSEVFCTGDGAVLQL